jgi:hypothetical protein
MLSIFHSKHGTFSPKPQLGITRNFKVEKSQTYHSYTCVTRVYPESKWLTLVRGRLSLNMQPPLQYIFISVRKK